jgi:hypothetical protein
MYELALRILLRHLEVIRSSLHSSLRSWEYVVVSGIALEAVVIGKEYWDGWHNHHRGTIRSPEKPSTFLFVIGIVGVVMVAGGITEQLSADSDIEAAETQIREVNELLFELVSQEAGNARASAEDAALAAARAEASAHNANAVVGKALNKSKEATETAGKAQGKADEVAKQAGDLLNKYAAVKSELTASEIVLLQERQKTTELIKSLNPRTLQALEYADNSTNLDVLKSLKKLAPDTGFIVESIPDFEARQAAEYIVWALRWVNLKVVCQGITNEWVTDGVTIETYLPPNSLGPGSPEYMDEMGRAIRLSEKATFVRAFLWANRWAKVSERPTHDLDVTPNVFRIRVGYKPNPFFDMGPQIDETPFLLPFAQPIDTIKKRIRERLKVNPSGSFPEPDHLCPCRKEARLPCRNP